MQTTSDEVLISRIAGGDRLAMQVLYARHHVRVYRFVLRLVRNEATAEDLISEVFLATGRKVRGTVCRLDMDVEYCAVQAGLIAGIMLNQSRTSGYQTASAPATDPGVGAFTLIRFAPQASSDDIIPRSQQTLDRCGAHGRRVL